MIKIYELINKHSGISVQELTKIAGADKDTVIQALKTLEKAGLITSRDGRVYPVKWTNLLPSDFA